MQPLNAQLFTELLAEQSPPCISVYQPTNRKFAGINEDAVRYRNQLRQVEQLLGQKRPRREYQPLLDRMAVFQDDPDFWRHQLDGLSVFCSPNLLRAVRLTQPVEQMHFVADSFHIKPLIRIIQASDRYEVLCVSQRRIALYQGGRNALDEVPIPRVPRDIVEALGEELTAPHQTVGSYGTGAQGPAMRHGHHSRKDEMDIDVERYLRVIDRAIREHHSRFSGLPLMLAAVEEYHPVFHKISRNPHLLKEGVKLNPDWLEGDRLRNEAWKVYEPHLRDRLAKAAEQYHAARARGLGTDDLMQAIEACRNGRVGTLLLEDRRRIGGRIDWNNGHIETGDIHQPGFEDLLDEVAERVLRTSGQAFVLPPDQMPSQTGLAAIYRY